VCGTDGGRRRGTPLARCPGYCLAQLLLFKWARHTLQFFLMPPRYPSSMTSCYFKHPTGPGWQQGRREAPTVIAGSVGASLPLAGWVWLEKGWVMLMQDTCLVRDTQELGGRMEGRASGRVDP